MYLLVDKQTGQVKAAATGKIGFDPERFDLVKKTVSLDDLAGKRTTLKDGKLESTTLDKAVDIKQLVADASDLPALKEALLKLL